MSRLYGHLANRDDDLSFASTVGAAGFGIHFAFENGVDLGLFGWLGFYHLI